MVRFPTLRNSGSLSNAFIDINNSTGNTGNTIIMGGLDYTGFTAANPAPTTVLNITGGNNYKLQFNSTTLTGATSSPTFNIGTGLSLILPGGFTVGTNLPTNIGAGTLLYSGNNTGAVATTPLTGIVAVAPPIAQTTTPLGTGGITLSGGSTLQISPIYSSSANTTGYTAGGFTAKYYSTGQTTTPAALNFGIAPAATLLGVQPNDVAYRNVPTGVTIGAFTTSLAV